MEEKRIGIYIRVSTEDQARTGYGLSDQERQCRKYAEIYFESRLKQIELYKDDGYSAKDFNRPEIKRLIKDIENGILDTIIVFKLDRLTRSVIDAYTFITKIIERNCALIAVLDHLDIHSANGRMFIGMLSIIAQWEREVISERTRAGLTEMVTEGKYPYGGKIPFGWKADADHRLSINKEDVEVLNWLADLCMEGTPIRKIRQRLKEEKHISLSWDQIKNYLIRPINIGKFYFQEKIYENIVPAIWTEKRQLEIIKALEDNQKLREDLENYPFQHLVYCQCGQKTECHSTYKQNSGGLAIYYYYKCPNCNQRISQSLLEAKLKQQILIIYGKKDKSKRCSTLKKRLYRINKKKEELYEEYLNENIPKESYIYSINRAHIEEQEILKELEHMEKKKISYDVLSNKEKYEMVHIVIQKIIVNTTSKEIIDVVWKE